MQGMLQARKLDTEVLAPMARWNGAFHTVEVRLAAALAPPPPVQHSLPMHKKAAYRGYILSRGVRKCSASGLPDFGANV